MKRLVFWIIAGLLGAGLVHGISLLLIPFLAEATAYDRLEAAAADGRFALLPDAGSPGLALPFEDPAFIRAACRYSLAEGPVRIFAPLPGSYGSVSFYTRFGQVYYSLTDRAASGGGVSVVILGGDQVEAAGAAVTRANEREPLRIVSPTETGFVMLRLFVPSLAARTGLDALAQTARCEETLEPPKD